MADSEAELPVPRFSPEAMRFFGFYDVLVAIAIIGIHVGMFAPWRTGRVCILGCGPVETRIGWDEAGVLAGPWVFVIPFLLIMRRQRFRMGTMLVVFLLTGAVAAFDPFGALFETHAVHWGEEWTRWCYWFGVAAAVAGLIRSPSIWDPKPMRGKWWP